MGVNLSIKGVPEPVAERLRARAERHHRSLQGELMAIVEHAAAEPTAPAVPPEATAAPEASQASVSRQGWRTVADLIAERRERARQGRHPQAPDGLPSAVDIVRADRDSR